MALDQSVCEKSLNQSVKEKGYFLNSNCEVSNLKKNAPSRKILFRRMWLPWLGWKLGTELLSRSHLTALQESADATVLGEKF